MKTANRPTLGKGIFDLLGRFDLVQINDVLDKEIAETIRKIDEAKHNKKEGMRARLAETVAEVDDGLVCKTAFEKHPLFRK